MIYSSEVQRMCPVAKGAYHGPAPIPEEGKWVQAKEIKDISGLTHGIGWCAPQQGACKLTLNVKEGVIEEALVETIGCSGMTHSAAMASEILIGKTLLEALNTDLVCDAINTAMRELFLQIVYGRSQTAFSEGGLPVGASLEDLGKGLRSQVGTMFATKEKGPRYLEMAEGYCTRVALNKDSEIIVGLQTDEPLKRACNPFGGMRMVRDACKQYGYEVSPKIEEEFKYHKTHNDGVFSAYTKDVREARHVGLLTGLPDAYGRGRIIGDYRRVALYGVNRLIEEKQKDKDALGEVPTTEKEIRCAEELSDQIKALKDMIAMAASYGFDISRPAENAKEAVQWLYFGYLAGIKEQNGAAMSLGRTSTFLDIYFERDIEAGLMTESEAQEIMDDFVLHLRMARHLRTPEYNELFGGDPMWITEAVGGIGEDGRHMVTKNSYRMLNTLYNLNAAAEPNLTVLWSENLPENWKKFIAKVSIDTDALQYENDDVMRPYYGDDYAIACCVSAMRVGKDMQFFGARANIAKLMMMAINGGRDENKFEQVGPEMPVMEGDVLDYEEVLRRMDIYRPWLAKTYVSAMNTIHYMHDKYAYEKSQMALHDTEVRRLMAFGIAGMSCMADSLSAIKYAKVKPIRNPENGIIVDFEIEGDFPKFGNDDDRVDSIACEQVEKFYQALTQFPLYRGAIHTMSILTITSNVMYGKKTGNTPDYRKASVCI